MTAYKLQARMSVRILRSELSTEQIADIRKDCYVIGAENKYGPRETLKAYSETRNAVYVPFGYYKTKFGKSPHKDTVYPKVDYTLQPSFSFRTDGGRDQEIVFNQAKNVIKMHRSLLLSLYCGFGKTMMGIILAHTAGMKCAVLVHRGVLFDQWIESIEKFTTARVQRVDTDGILDPHADFYIFNTAFVHKYWSKTQGGWVPKRLGVYSQIGTLIVDEAHIAAAPEMSKALMYFNPRIAIALTATPVRKDGMDAMLELYFGKYADTQIIRIASNPFTVYRVPTGIKPTFTTNSQGGKDWNSLISSIIESEPRNEMLVKLACKIATDSSRIILILTKRKTHAKVLSTALRAKGVTTSIMTGTQKEYDKTAQILIGTYSKLGVGFDDTRLNTLIVACSVTEIEQYAGRLRDGLGKNRVVYDLVDTDGNCIKHWGDRKKWYLSRKGIIRTLDLATLDEECDDKNADTHEEQQKYTRLVPVIYEEGPGPDPENPGGYVRLAKIN